MRLRDLILGAMQGPAELVPVSSSAHAQLLGAEDKAAEVALHTGTALTLVAARPVLRPWFAALTVAPPALAALLLQDLVEERLSSRRAIAAGLVAGSAALWWAEGRADAGRDAADATPADALALGIAQATALWPGVSRSAATLATARGRGFGAAAAAELSREALLPVLTAATVRVAPRLRAHHVPAATVAALSTALALRLVPPPLRLRPFAAYRVALAVLCVWQDRRQ